MIIMLPIYYFIMSKYNNCAIMPLKNDSSFNYFNY